MRVGTTELLVEGGFPPVLPFGFVAVLVGLVELLLLVGLLLLLLLVLLLGLVGSDAVEGAFPELREEPRKQM